ncbi:hypothetical protein AV530_006027 [Patagioenas fasciata monilis]|uniref:Uncharacterized protein n=1 Tax=Patagioenas fasciata monilis TaxID=372326 RepID=A0A1V4J844_PATFA|nr:hypothetical protein AV530_006027 [Patagioenas fasciata monilis]
MSPEVLRIITELELTESEWSFVFSGVTIKLISGRYQALLPDGQIKKVDSSGAPQACTHYQEKEFLKKKVS